MHGFIAQPCSPPAASLPLGAALLPAAPCSVLFNRIPPCCYFPTALKGASASPGALPPLPPVTVGTPWPVPASRR